MPQDAGVATDLDMGEELLEMLKYLLLGVNALLFIAAALVFATSPKHSGTSANTSTNATAATPANTKHALLVTAHPDDESMFFLPLIHSLTQQQSSSSSGDSDAPEWEVHLLCLSRGNFDGLGAIREQEMRTCGAFLGLERANIHVLEDSQLQDGMQAQWDHAHIAKLVLEYIDTHAVNAVFTFDDYGVSGHANHIAVHYGVKQAIQEQHKRCSEVSGADDINEANENGKAPVPAPAPVRGWALESTSILRKYIGVLDALVSSWMLGGDSKESAFVFLCKPWWNYNAMALHHSQFVWYRRLFVLFSRYTFVNTFQPIVYIPTATALSLGETKKTQ